MTRLDRTIDRLYGRLAAFVDQWTGPVIALSILWLAGFVTDALVRNMLR